MSEGQRVDNISFCSLVIVYLAGKAYEYINAFTEYFKIISGGR